VTTDDTTCSIKPNTQLAELIRRAVLIIWDEAPMNSRYVFETVDKTLRDILRTSPSLKQSKPFGGKTVLLGGDFRQILPVVPKGRRADIVHVSLNQSELWKHCEVLTLSENMRLKQTDKLSDTEIQQNAAFANWLLRIGDGTEKTKCRGDENEGTWIKIPEEFLLEANVEPIETIFNSTYAAFKENFTDPTYLMERAILTPTNETIHELNAFVLQKVTGDVIEYLSADKIDEATGPFNDSDNLFPPEFLNTLTLPGKAYYTIYKILTNKTLTYDHCCFRYAKS
jgi:hypothetical protein